MAAGISGASESTVAVLAILVLIIARRTYLNLHGARYAPGRMFAWAGFALLFFVAFAATTIYAALGSWGPIAWLLTVPYVVTAVIAAAVTYPHVRKVVRFDRRDAGPVFYMLPWLVPVTYFVLYTARLVVEVVIFGLASIASFSFPTSLPTGTLVVVIGFDLLYAVSVGLLFGRGLAVRRAYLDAGPGGPAPRTTLEAGTPLRER